MEEDVYTLPSGITYWGEGWKRFAEDLGFNSAEDYADYIALAVEGISPNRIVDALAKRGITSPLLRKSLLAEIRMGMY